jgi:hypothetical protein
MLVVFLAVIAMMAQQGNGQTSSEHIQSPFVDDDVFRLKSIVTADNTNIAIDTPYTTVFQPTSNCECDMSITVANNVYNHFKIDNMISTKITREATTYDMTNPGVPAVSLLSYDMSILDVTMDPNVISTTVAVDQQALTVENAIASILPTVDKILLEESADMKMTAVFEGQGGGAMVFERA